MITSIDFLSLDKFRGLKPDPATVVVSILDQEEAPRRPRLAGWRSVLAMTFEDTYEENKYSSVMWPLEPTDEEHARFCQAKGNRVPALSDARQLVEFLHKHGTSTEQLKLVVHCYGGISRSAAVATWAAARFWLPLPRAADYPNMRLLRLLDVAQKELHARNALEVIHREGIFGTVELTHFDLPDDPVIDVPPTGSPEFSAFVATDPGEKDKPPK